MPRGRPRKVIAEQAQANEVVQTAQVAQTTEVSQETKTQAAPKRAVRPSRVPINGYRDVLSVEGQEPGWHYSWITDANVARMEMAGFDFVEHDVVVGNRRINAASQIGSKVSIPGGNGVTLFLMRCPDELYDEEMELMHKEIDEKERALIGNLNSNQDGRYGKVEISRK